MVTIYAKETARLMSCNATYKNIIWGVCIAGAKSDYIDPSKQFSVPDCSEQSIRNVVRFIDQVPQDDIIFVISPKLAVQLAVFAAFSQPDSLEELVNDQLGNEDLYKLIKNIQYEGSAHAKATSYFTEDPGMQGKGMSFSQASTKVLGSLKDRVQELVTKFNFEDVAPKPIQVNEYQYLLYLSGRFSLDRELSSYLKKNFAYAQRFDSPVWGDDSMLYALSDEAWDVPQALVQDVFDAQNKQ